jgi:outer membrane autotransporter protein
LGGFSLAGGATSWSLAGGLGGGSSVVFLAGLYGAKQFGAAYVSGAFSYSNYWMSTNRTATVAGLNQLQADFKADNFGARLEGGYHLPSRMAVQWTPYAAISASSGFAVNLCVDRFSLFAARRAHRVCKGMHPNVHKHMAEWI